MPLSQVDTSGTTNGSDGNSVDASSILAHLEDDTNRYFLSAMSLEWLTARELTAIADTPLSTTYRKLNAMEEAGLLDRRKRIADNGKHPEEYRCRPIVVSFRLGGPSGLEMSVATTDSRQ